MFSPGFLWILLAVSLYGLLHSLLASTWLKEWVERRLGEKARRYYRLFFVAFVSITFLPVLALILLLPDRILYIIPYPWFLLTAAVQGLALLGIFMAFKDISVSHFLGFQQASHAEGEPPTPPFVVRGVFRFTRHPLYLFSILIIWLFPLMTWNVLAFNIGATLYMLIGTIPEERKLLEQFGKDYAEYRRRTPWLIPCLKPISSAREDLRSETTRLTRRSRDLLRAC